MKNHAIHEINEGFHEVFQITLMESLSSSNKCNFLL